MSDNQQPRSTVEQVSEAELSAASWSAGDAVVKALRGQGVKLTTEAADQVRMRVADEAEKELRRIRRGE